jgi:hypothetical protein
VRASVFQERGSDRGETHTHTWERQTEMCHQRGREKMRGEERERERDKS